MIRFVALSRSFNRLQPIMILYNIILYLPNELQFQEPQSFTFKKAPLLSLQM